MKIPCKFHVTLPRECSKYSRHGQRVRARGNLARRVQTERHTFRVESVVGVCIRRTLIKTVLHPVQSARAWLGISREGGSALSCWSTAGNRTSVLTEQRCYGIQSTYSCREHITEFIDEITVESSFQSTDSSVHSGASVVATAGKRSETLLSVEVTSCTGVGAEEVGLTQDGGYTGIQSDDAINTFREEHGEAPTIPALRRNLLGLV